MAEVVYLDANVFIYPLLYNDERAANAHKFLQKVVRGEANAVTSTLAMDEVIWKVWKEKGNRELGIKAGKYLLQLDHLQMIDINRRTMAIALHLMEEYTHLKPRDAIHLAAALSGQATVMFSDDSDFKKVKVIKWRPLS